MMPSPVADDVERAPREDVQLSLFSSPPTARAVGNSKINWLERPLADDPGADRSLLAPMLTSARLSAVARIGREHRPAD
jgi:hypothetical protein